MASFEMTPETSEQVRQYGKQVGCTADEAAERLTAIGINRVSALRRYAKTHAPAAKPAKAKAPKAKKAKAAKGPLARKVKKAPKSAEVPTQIQ